MQLKHISECLHAWKAGLIMLTSALFLFKKKSSLADMKKCPVCCRLLVMILFLCLRQTSSLNVYTVKRRGILTVFTPPRVTTKEVK